MLLVLHGKEAEATNTTKPTMLYCVIDDITISLLASCLLLLLSLLLFDSCRCWCWLNCAMSRLLISVAVVLLALVALSEAVDRSKFKTCQQSGFCRRNRDFAKQTAKSAYSVVAGSEKQTADTFTVELLNHFDKREFVLTISNYADDTVRTQIREKSPPFARYEVPDTLVDSAVPVAYQALGSGEAPKRIFGKVELINEPFGLRFFGSDGQEIITANAKGLFNIEHPSKVVDDDADASAADMFVPESNDYRVIGTDDAWEETFSGHRDKKPKGPTSISMDFTFHQSKHLYGIPEHAADFALRATMYVQIMATMQVATMIATKAKKEIID
jgi:mannosyl-oligosaccharide alpha-1,3-glucosidase